jgi:hypothetical protein
MRRRAEQSVNMTGDRINALPLNFGGGEDLQCSGYPNRRVRLYQRQFRCGPAE